MKEIKNETEWTKLLVSGRGRRASEAIYNLKLSQYLEPAFLTFHHPAPHPLDPRLQDYL